MTKGASVKYVDPDGTHDATIDLCHSEDPKPLIDLTFTDRQGSVQHRVSVAHMDTLPRPASYYF